MGGRGHHDLQPGGVGVEGVAGQVPQAGGLGLGPVLDPGVLPMPQVQTGQLTGDHPDRGVGDERGDPVPVGAQRGQPVGAGMQPSATSAADSIRRPTRIRHGAAADRMTSPTGAG